MNAGTNPNAEQSQATAKISQEASKTSNIKQVSILKKNQPKYNIQGGKFAHSCDFCGKGFMQQSTLNLHLKKHAGEKPFTCGICNEAFSTKNLLVIHMKSHVVNKPYKCKLCETSFATSHEIISHRKKVHASN